MKQKTKQPDSLSHQFSWEQRFKELEEFKKEYGHCNVRRRYSLNPALGQWVSGVRKAKKHGKLAEERVRRLDAIGICWERRTTWEQRIIDLKAFKNKYGHCNVPRRYQPNPALGNWVSNLRQSKKLGTLAEERVSCLNALGFVWVRLKRRV
ncbi:MAG: helicase associated domain-containing protein [Planctomycetota bacterium]